MIRTIKQRPIVRAVDQDAYQWLQQYAPHYITAIEDELASGVAPGELRAILSMELGPDRQGLALRCEQAARYIQESSK